VVAHPRMLDHTGFFWSFIMQPLRIVRLCSPLMILTIGFALSLTLTGCGSGSATATAVEQATAGHEAAKSSMDYMKKHRSEASQPVKKVNIKTH
jgi:hypothetical protein